jgi:hypothetical protein
MNKRIEEIRHKLSILDEDYNDKVYLLNKLEKYEQALTEIEDESSHDDADITRINGIAQDTLKEEG